MSSSSPLFLLNLSPEEREKLKEERKMKRREMKETRDNQRKLEKEENDQMIKTYEAQIKASLDEIKYTKKQLKSKLSTGNRKNKLLEKIENIKYDISINRINILKCDKTFMTRNMIRTKMCPKVILKGKECKYENCTYAHKEEELRKPKCLYHMFNICEYSNNCIHDHSNSEIPEIPNNPIVEEVKEEKKEESLVILSSSNSINENVINNFINEGKDVVLNSDIPEYQYYVNIGTTKLFCNKKTEEIKEIMDLLK